MSTSKYLNLITSEHKTKPKFMSWLNIALGYVDDAENASSSIIPAFDLDNAIGVQQDILGQIVGISRILSFQPSDGSSPVLDDDTFNLILRAKIAQNQWDGTTKGILDTWNNVLPGLNLYIADNQDMSMNAIVTGTSTLLQQNLIANGYIVPKPQGVSIQYEFEDLINLNEYFAMPVQEGTFETIIQES